MHGVRQQCGKGVGDGARRADQRGWQILEVQTCSLLGSDSILCQRPTYSHQVCIQAIPTVAHIFFFSLFNDPGIFFPVGCRRNIRSTEGDTDFNDLFSKSLYFRHHREEPPFLLLPFLFTNP